MNEFKLIIFDWDGTLMNSIEHIVDSLQYAMHKTDSEILDRKQTSDIIGLGLIEAVQALFPAQAENKNFIDAFCRHYRDNYLDPSKQTELFAGAQDTLHELLNSGYELAVATSKSRAGLDIVLKGLDMEHLFSTTRTADESRTKPYPDMLNDILTSTGTNRKNAVMIGDTEYDLQMAKNAEMASIAVSYGVHHLDRLYQHEPIGHIDEVSELPLFLAEQKSQRVNQ